MVQSSTDQSEAAGSDSQLAEKKSTQSSTASSEKVESDAAGSDSQLAEKKSTQSSTASSEKVESDAAGSDGQPAAKRKPRPLWDCLSEKERARMLENDYSDDSEQDKDFNPTSSEGSSSEEGEESSVEESPVTDKGKVKGKGKGKAKGRGKGRRVKYTGDAAEEISFEDPNFDPLHGSGGDTSDVSINRTDEDEGDENEAKKTRSKRKRVVPRRAASETPRVEPAIDQLNHCPVPDCSYTARRGTQMVNHLVKKHAWTTASAETGGPGPKGTWRRVEICRFCRTAWGNMARHMTLCLLNPVNKKERQPLRKYEAADPPPLAPTDAGFGVPLPKADPKPLDEILARFQRWALHGIKQLRPSTVRNYICGLRFFFEWQEQRDKSFIAGGLLDFGADRPIRAPDITMFFTENADKLSQRHSAVNGYQAFLKFMLQDLSDRFQELDVPPTLENGMRPNPYEQGKKNIDHMAGQAKACVARSNTALSEKAQTVVSRQFEELAFRCDDAFQLLVIHSFLNCDYVKDLDERLLGGEMEGGLLSEAWVRNYLMLRLLLTGGGQRSVAIRNFTLEEWQNLTMCKDDIGNKCFVVQCKDHKTPRLPANIFVESDELRSMLQLWAEVMRPRFFPKGYAPNPAETVIERYGDNSSRTFFLSERNAAVTRIDASIALFKEIVSEHVSKQLVPEGSLDGVSSHDFRVGNATWAATHPDIRIREIAAEIMNHSTSVHSKFYVKNKQEQAAYFGSARVAAVKAAGADAPKESGPPPEVLELLRGLQTETKVGSNVKLSLHADAFLEAVHDNAAVRDYYEAVLEDSNKNTSIAFRRIRFAIKEPEPQPGHSGLAPPKSKPSTERTRSPDSSELDEEADRAEAKEKAANASRAAARKKSQQVSTEGGRGLKLAEQNLVRTLFPDMRVAVPACEELARTNSQFAALWNRLLQRHVPTLKTGPAAFAAKVIRNYLDNLEGGKGTKPTASGPPPAQRVSKKATPKPSKAPPTHAQPKDHAKAGTSSSDDEGG
jgi:hypothetical protein